MTAETTIGSRQANRNPVFTVIFAVLAIFTLLEIGSAYLSGLPSGVRIGLLAFLAIVKVVLVLMYFMHLRFDDRMFAMPFALGLVLIVPIILVIGLTTHTVGAAGPSGAASQASNGGTTVNVSLTTYEISPDTDSVPAGTVTFNVSNDATDMMHEMLIIKTDKSPDELPLDDKGNLARMN